MITCAAAYNVVVRGNNMNRLRFAWLAAFALLVSALPATASKTHEFPGTFVLNDQANAFSKSAADKADAELRGTTFDRPVHFIVETFAKIPDDKKTAFDAAADKKKFYHDWAHELYSKNKDRGIYVQIVKTGHIEVVVDDQIAERGHFTNQDTAALVKKFAEAFNRAKGKTGTEAQADRDQGLQDATEFVVSQLKGAKNAGKAPHPAPKTEHAPKASTGMGIGGWLCIGLVALLGVWLVIGLFRAFSGGGGGGGMGGGGGGGFMTSLFGGLFGAMAGMWLYNSFFGHGSMFGGSDAYASDNTGYGDSGGGSYDDSGAGDTSGDYGGGGDFDGGGDWGGGGDFGGGDF
jgi:uncharacterized protein